MKKKLPILFLLLIAVSIVACKKDEDEPIVPETLYTVKYNMTGTGSVNYSVTYKDSTGALQSLFNISSGWIETFNGRKGDTLYLSATNTNISGTVYGSISIDNTIVVDSAGASLPHIEITAVIP